MCYAASPASWRVQWCEILYILCLWHSGRVPQSTTGKLVSWCDRASLHSHTHTGWGHTTPPGHSTPPAQTHTSHNRPHNSGWETWGRRRTSSGQVSVCPLTYGYPLKLERDKERFMQIVWDWGGRTVERLNSDTSHQTLFLLPHENCDCHNVFCLSAVSPMIPMPEWVMYDYD